MKFLLISFPGLFISLGIFGQHKIGGKIETSKGKPIPFANVFLMSAADTSFVKGGMTNESGEYEMGPIAEGNYFLKYTAVGFRSGNSFHFELGSSPTFTNLGTVILEVESKELKEVVVSAAKPLFQQEIDRTIVNVQSDVFTKGSSALEVLARSPGVRIDLQNSAIVLNGKGGVGIMINGKLIRLPAEEIYNMLGGMNAGNIEKIELLPVPPVKYDAEGLGGMINIVLKKDEEQGMKGSLLLTGGYGMGPKSGASINLNQRSGKLAVYGSYSYSYYKTYWGLIAKGGFQFPQDVGKGERTYDFTNERWPDKAISETNIGFDYQISKNTTIGASSIISGIYQTSEGYTQSNYTIYGDSLLSLRSDMHERDNLRSTVNDLNIERLLGKGGKIIFDIDYLHYRDHNPSAYFNSFLDRKGEDISSQSTGFFPQQDAMKETVIDILAYKIDYEQKLSSVMRLEAGLKVSDSKIVNTVGINDLKNGVWTTDATISNQMTMREPIKAAYSSLDLSLKKTSVNIGLRYEYTSTNIGYDVSTKQGFERNTGNLFPSILVFRKLSETSNIRLTYNQRIRRPSYNDIAPGITFNDIYSIIIGNPLLKPVITDNLQAQWQFKQYLFSLTYSRENNAIVDGQQSESLTDSIFYQMSHNLKYQEDLALQASFPVTITPWWKIESSVRGAWNQFEAQVMPDENFVTADFKQTYLSYSLYCSQHFILPKNFFIEFSQEYYSVGWWGAYMRKPYGVLNLVVKKDLRSMGSLQLSVSDLLESTHYRTSLNVPDLAYHIHSNIDISPESRRSRIVKLTYYKSFGNNKVKSQRKWNKSVQDELDRIGEN